MAGITEHTDAPRAAELRWVAASSWPASQAVAVAEEQGAQVAERVLRRLRETVFVLGEPADTPERVAAALHGVPGLDRGRLLADAAGPAARERVRRDRAEARCPVPEVMAVTAPGPHPGAAKETGDGHRYALPTVLLHGPAGRRAVPGWRPLAAYLAAAAEVCPGLGPVSVESLTAGRLLSLYRSLTRVDLAAAGLPAEPPPAALRVPSGHGELWLHPAEAPGSLLAARAPGRPGQPPQLP
ncbi:hypothetical protein ACFYNO_39480 [Kitasatospora sp. NPDC006697]|uniref:hypothetical protein n=1 Tax=Kitasatospora sp. NPDC006697 TaxID=3364020 RepID=UPI00369C9203